MRKLAGVLLLVAMPLSLVLGGVFLLSSRYRAISAEIESQDLSAVASDLASPDELAGERTQADQRLASRNAGRGGKQLALGVALLAAALLQLVGGMLALVGRGRRPVVVVAFVSLAVVVFVLALEGFNLLGASCGAVLLAAALFGLRASRTECGDGVAASAEDPG